MNTRNLTFLSVAAILILVAAFWIGHSRAPEQKAQQALYPDLKGKLDAVKTLSVYKAGEQLAVELVRTDGIWQVKQRDNFPADATKTNSLLMKLEETTIREQKTANPENYAALDVQDVSDAATTGVRLELTGATPVNLIVGKRDATTRSTYVRRAAEKQSWLIDSDFDISADPARWLKHEFVNISLDRIHEVTTQLTDAPAYTYFKNTRTDSNFDVKPLPKGRELGSATAPNFIDQALSSLPLSDVRPASELTNEKSTGHTEFRTFDGLVLEFKGYKIGEHHWVTLHASFDADLAKRFYEPPATPEKAPANDKSASDKKETDKQPPTDDTSLAAVIKKGQAEAAALNTSFTPWGIALAAYKYDVIFKPLEEMLKPIKTAETPTPLMPKALMPHAPKPHN